MPLWKPGGQRGEAAPQETPALALKRRNCELATGFVSQLWRWLGQKGRVPHKGHSLTWTCRVSFSSSCLPSRLPKSCQAQGGPCGGSGQSQQGHLGTQGEGGRTDPRRSSEMSKEPRATPPQQ